MAEYLTNEAQRQTYLNLLHNTNILPVPVSSGNTGNLTELTHFLQFRYFTDAGKFIISVAVDNSKGR
jgi:hypothetical protein